MDEDPWLVNLVRTLRRAKTRDEVRDVIEVLEDRYDAFSGPGQELVDELLDEARKRLRGL
ncbi:MAG TPA: hypothetical protein PLQ64_15380 [Thiobacillaceae bacterium]|nr:hypothetical protein [Thiobacillaceae bacterium]HNA83854.1 hypothetical protein [Thiobacillaceae bacterium]HNH90384.1 hypothetical protein [Thiobacillaceae bacterium]HNI09059.1 hypothetical protein [Thiobacillaceae bacterium]